jgi:tetratricopeptide (TPR) repeat protein
MSATPTRAAASAQLQAALAAGDALAEATARTNLACIALSEDAPDAVDLFAQALAATRRAATVRSEAILLVNFVPALFERGDAARALELAHRAVEITARSAVDQRVLARLSLGRICSAGYHDHERGAAAIREALDALDDYARRAPDRAAELAARLSKPLAHAGETAVAAGDHALALRVIAAVEPARAEALRAQQPAAYRPPQIDALLARDAPALDAAFAAWRARTRTAEIDDARVAAANVLGWNETRATRARASRHIDPAVPTRGGVGGMLLLVDDIVAGRASVSGALPTARALGLGDDDLVFVLAVAGRRDDAPPAVVLLELVAGAAADDALGANCARLAAAVHSQHGANARALELFVQAEARLADGVDDRLRADVINSQAAELLALGRHAQALAAAQRARTAALAAHDDAIARMALGNQGTALLNLRRAGEALPLFDQVAAEHQAAGDAKGLEITRFNLAAAKMALGEPVAESEFDAGSSDPDHVFAAAYAIALAGDLPRAVAAFRSGFERFKGQRYASEAGARSNFARVLYDAGEFGAVAEQLRLAARLFEQRGERDELIGALLRLASTEVSPLTAAVAAAEQAVAVARGGAAPDQLADALGTLGQLQLVRRRAPAAVAALTEAVAISPRPELRRALAAAWIEDGRADDALPVLEESIAAARAAGGEDLVLALASKAQAVRALDRRGEAIAVLREARAVAQTLPPSRNVALLLNDLGWALVESAALVEAAAVLEQALACARAARAPDAESAVLNNLGMALTESGDYDGATAAFKAGRELARRRADARGEGAAVFGLANVAAAEHRTDAARDLYREAAGLGQQTGDSALHAAALDSLATMHMVRGEAAAAVDYQRQAAQLHHALGAWLDEATDWLNLSSSYLWLRELDNAQAALDAARALAAEQQFDELAAPLASVQAQLLAQRGAWRGARAAHWQAIEQFETRRARLATPAEQRRLAARQHAAYGLAVEDALAAGDGRAAIEFLECGRTRFLQSMLARRGARPATVPEAVMRRYESVLDRVDALRRQRRAAIATPDAKLAVELARAQAELEALRATIDAARADAPPAQFDAPRFDELVAALPRGCAAVYLCITNRGLGVACAGRDAAGDAWSAAALEPAFTRHDLSALVLGDSERWRNARTFDDIPDHALGWALVVHAEHPALWQRALAHVCRVLGARVWPAIERALDRRGERLILLPGAGFSVLPLHAALLADGGRAQDRFDTRYAPSLRLLARASRGAPLSAQPALGQAVDPTGDLPFAVLEARCVAARMTDSPRAAASGAQATPDAVLQLFAQQELVHFCGHGGFDAHEPLQSRLHCATDPRTQARLLTVRTLLEQAKPLACRLAVLSACDSGRVDATDLLDDALGLPGALLTAGCRGVIATLWRVNDLAACLLVDEAIRVWREERVTLSAALARAARWLREASGAQIAERLEGWNADGDPLRAQPRPFADELHWAAFHLTGLPELIVD